MATSDEAEVVRKVDRNPKAHANSTAEEQEILRQLYGDPDEGGIFRSAPGEEGVAE